MRLPSSSSPSYSWFDCASPLCALPPRLREGGSGAMKLVPPCVVDSSALVSLMVLPAPLVRTDSALAPAPFEEAELLRLARLDLEGTVMVTTHSPLRMMYACSPASPCTMMYCPGSKAATFIADAIPRCSLSSSWLSIGMDCSTRRRNSASSQLLTRISVSPSRFSSLLRCSASTTVKLVAR